MNPIEGVLSLYFLPFKNDLECIIRLKTSRQGLDVDQLTYSCTYTLDWGLFWSKKLDVKFILVFIRCKDTHVRH